MDELILLLIESKREFYKSRLAVILEYSSHNFSLWFIHFIVHTFTMESFSRYRSFFIICLHIVCHSYFFKCSVKQDSLILEALQHFISFFKIVKLKIFDLLILFHIGHKMISLPSEIIIVFTAVFLLTQKMSLIALWILMILKHAELRRNKN